MNYLDQMEALKENLGKKIFFEYVCDGTEGCVKSAILKELKPFLGISINRSPLNIMESFLFNGWGTAIKRITDESGVILYQNSDIDNTYTNEATADFHGFNEKLFGHYSEFKRAAGLKEKCFKAMPDSFNK